MNDHAPPAEYYAGRLLGTDFVWRTSFSEPEPKMISVLAIVETVLSVALCFGLWAWKPTLLPIWVSIVAAPLLLLRSRPSIELGVSMFERYVDHSFSSVTEAGRGNFFKARFVVAMTLAMISTGAFAYLISWQAPVASDYVIYCIEYLFIGYLATQAAVMISVATRAHEMASVAKYRTSIFLMGLVLIAAVWAGVFFSTRVFLAPTVAAAATAMLIAVGVAGAPKAFLLARKSTDESEASSSRNLGFAIALVNEASLLFGTVAPGIFLGVWLRSLATRFWATLRHLIAGLEAMPENWRRTLFMTDFFSTPELIPEYSRADPINIREFLKMRRTTTGLVRYVCNLSLLILYLPAYLYRLSIKSTFWVYAPLIYIVSQPRFADRQPLLRDLVLLYPWEKIRRFFAVFAILAFLVLNSTLLDGLQYPKISLIEYSVTFAFSVTKSSVKFWQWLALLSAVITIALYFVAWRLKIHLKHEQSTPMNAITARLAHVIEWGLRVRNISSLAFLAIAVCHALLAVSNIQYHLPSTFLRVATAFYGDSMPPAPPR